MPCEVLFIQQAFKKCECLRRKVERSGFKKIIEADLIVLGEWLGNKGGEERGRQVEGTKGVGKIGEGNVFTNQHALF